MTTSTKLLLRLAFSTLIVLALAQTFQHRLLELLLPLMAYTMQLVLHDFTMQSLSLDWQSGVDTLQIRADLTAPLWINNSELKPLAGQGWYEVTMTAGGVLQYSVCMLIITFTWPATTWYQVAQRLFLAIPIAIGLALMTVAITLPAELWSVVADQWLPGKTWPLVTVSQILMSGGGLILAIVLGTITALVIRPRPTPLTGDPVTTSPAFFRTP